MNKETLEEAALRYASKKLQRTVVPYRELNANVAEYVGFINGANWQAERMYSEEEVIEILTQRCKHFGTSVKPFDKLLLKQDLEWFEQFKKK